ncbi:hypothetical protein DFH07DRAFT_780293 [Mycena maculata]|uniref:Uncharacterized protein n=1 Tax=Mycena maculata TaxID=230809 RepID=A0AAD7MVV2_9AGAR|nr:hypothetical protein DFH07DRAFT_780293 [Mycena maculata]
MKLSISSIILAALLAESYALPAPSGINEEPVSTSGSSSVPPLASTQYHATCADTALKIKNAAQSKKLTLLPPVPAAAGEPYRSWPDEFTWSGGFYLTPKLEDAQSYGALFVPNCNDPGRGGVVVMRSSELCSSLPHVLIRGALAEFTLDVEHPVPLNVKNLGTDEEVGDTFIIKQTAFGKSIRKLLKSNDDEKSPLAFPTKSKIETYKKGKKISDWTAYDDIAGMDVVVGAAPMTFTQQNIMNHAVNQYKIPAIGMPWVQVVLITDEGKRHSH